MCPNLLTSKTRWALKYQQDFDVWWFYVQRVATCTYLWMVFGNAYLVPSYVWQFLASNTRSKLMSAVTSLCWSKVFFELWSPISYINFPADASLKNNKMIEMLSSYSQPIYNWLSFHFQNSLTGERTIVTGVSYISFYLDTILHLETQINFNLWCSPKLPLSFSTMSQCWIFCSVHQRNLLSWVLHWMLHWILRMKMFCL